MLKNRPIGIHTLVQKAIRHARQKIQVRPCFLSDRTIRFTAGLSVHELFLYLKKLGVLSATAYRAHYHPVRRAVVAALRYEWSGVV